MHYVQAVIAMGLFGWLGYAIAFDALPGGDGGSSKTRALMAMADKMTTELGPMGAGGLCLAIGVVLAFFFVRRGTA